MEQKEDGHSSSANNLVEDAVNEVENPNLKAEVLLSRTIVENALLRGQSQSIVEHAIEGATTLSVTAYSKPFSRTKAADVFSEPTSPKEQMKEAFKEQPSSSATEGKADRQEDFVAVTDKDIYEMISEASMKKQPAEAQWNYENFISLGPDLANEIPFIHVQQPHGSLQSMDVKAGIFTGKRADLSQTPSEGSMKTSLDDDGDSSTKDKIKHRSWHGTHPAKPTTVCSTPGSMEEPDETAEQAKRLVDSYVRESKNMVDDAIATTFQRLETSMSEREKTCESLKEKPLSKESTVVSRENDFVLQGIEYLSIEQFSVEMAEEKIHECVKTWEFQNNWLYCVDFLGKDTFPYDTRYRFRVRWSIPTRRKPIPRATASIYFTFVVSTIKPKHYPVDIFYVLETCRLVHRPGQSRFREKWLKDIIECKVSMMNIVSF